MYSFKDDILQTLFGGGIADYEMLEQCNYEFEDILQHIKMFTTIDDMRFDDIIVGACDEYRSNIQNKIDEKIKEVESELKGLEDYSDTYNGDIDREYTNKIIDLREELEKLQELDSWEDIEYFANCLDSHIFINDDKTKKIYKEYLSKEIEEENEKIGFIAVDLDDYED